jgi:hypothetical protein
MSGLATVEMLRGRRQYGGLHYSKRAEVSRRVQNLQPQLTTKAKPQSLRRPRQPTARRRGSFPPFSQSEICSGVPDSGAKCNSLCGPDLHVFAKLFEDRLERGLEVQGFFSA